jgi:hypothetical protein
MESRHFSIHRETSFGDKIEAKGDVFTVGLVVFYKKTRQLCVVESVVSEQIGLRALVTNRDYNTSAAEVIILGKESPTPPRLGARVMYQNGVYEVVGVDAESNKVTVKSVYRPNSRSVTVNWEVAKMVFYEPPEDD